MILWKDFYYVKNMNFNRKYQILLEFTLLLFGIFPCVPKFVQHIWNIYNRISIDIHSMNICISCKNDIIANEENNTEKLLMRIKFYESNYRIIKLKSKLLLRNKQVNARNNWKVLWGRQSTSPNKETIKYACLVSGNNLKWCILLRTLF